MVRMQATGDFAGAQSPAISLKPLGVPIPGATLRLMDDGGAAGGGTSNAAYPIRTNPPSAGFCASHSAGV